MATNFEDIMTCAVCLDFYEEPKILPCKNGSHVFCKKCLKSLVTENNAISCPKCRENHQIPDGDVDNLTTDLNMREMIATFLCVDCRTFDKFCKPCAKCGVRSCHVCICGHDDGEKCELLGAIRRVTRQLPTPPQKEAMNQLLEDWGSFREKNSKERQETDERMTVLIESLQQKRRDILQVFDEYDKYASERIAWFQQPEEIEESLQITRNNINDMTPTAVNQAHDSVRNHGDTISKKGAMLSEVIPDNLCTVYTERLQREITHFGNQITRRKAGKDMDVDLVFGERNCNVRTVSDDAWSSTPLVAGTIHVYRHIGGLYQFNVMDDEENDEDKILKTFQWNNRRPQTGEPTMDRHLWTTVPWVLKTGGNEEKYYTLITDTDRRCAFQNVLEHVQFMDKE